MLNLDVDFFFLFWLNDCLLDGARRNAILATFFFFHLGHWISGIEFHFYFAQNLPFN